MIRKTVVGLVAALAMILGIFAFGGTTNADANGNCPQPYNIATGAAVTVPDGFCEAQIAYGGPFANAPAAPYGPYGFGSLNPVAGGAADAGAAAGGTGGALALTGSESTVLAYFGAGAIAFGAVALGSRRKFFQGTLD